MNATTTYARPKLMLETGAAEEWHPFCDAGRLATAADDKVAADGYRDGLEGRDRLAEIEDGADRIAYRAALASGRLDREIAEQGGPMQATAEEVAEYAGENEEEPADDDAPAPVYVAPIATITIRGRLVLANSKTGYPVGYGNQTQADRKAAELRAAGIDCHARKPCNIRPFYVWIEPSA